MYVGIPKAMRVFMQMQASAIKRCVCKPCDVPLPVVKDGAARECGQVHHQTVRRAHWRTVHGAM